MATLNFKSLLCFSGLSLISTFANADWQLNNNASSFYYISSKAAAISEVNTFSNLQGQIKDDGSALLRIDLSSVDTAIDVRNQRVRDILFEVMDYPEATASLNVDIAAIQNIEVGASVTASYPVQVKLHGMSQTVNADLQVTKLKGSNLQVDLVLPLIINASSFGLTEGVEALKNVASLSSINPNVVISFSLVFMQ